MKPSCEHVRTWLLSQDELHITAPSDDVSAHVATCPHCRGALLLLMSQLLDIPADIQPLSCDQCQQSLAAYIDEESDNRLPSAARIFPEVWLHLWTCVECAETYRVMVSVLEQTWPTSIQADITQVQPARARTGIQKQHHIAIPQFTLSRALLNQMFQMRFRLGVAWGPGDGDLIVLDETSDGYEVQLSVRRQPDGDWTIIVRIEPPVIGQAVLTIGIERLLGPFDPDGQARFISVPDALIGAPDGPSLSLAVELRSV